MKFVAVAVVTLSTGLLTGCASSPKEKPFMSWGQYDQVAHLTNAINRCLSRKELSLEHAAIGRELIDDRLTQLNYDQAYLAWSIKDKSTVSVDTPVCTELAVRYEQVRQNRAASARLPSFQMPMPTNTTCRTTFGTTHCTIY